MRPSFYPGLLIALFCLACPFRSDAGSLFFKDNDEWFLNMVQQQRFNTDTSAAAIILYEKSSYDLESGLQLNGTMKKEVHRVIKILKQSGVAYGDVTILEHSAPGRRTDIRGLKGTTYSMENGQLVAHKLSTDNVARDKTSYLVQSKFSMPAVQAGTVLDIHYTIESPVPLLFAHYNFQHDIPTLYSELETYMPATFDFLTLTQAIVESFREFDDSRRSLTEDKIPEAYFSSEVLTGGEVLHKRWVRRNIPAIPEEPFAPAAANFQEQIQLRINGNHTGPFSKGIMESWEKVNDMLIESFSFYQPLTHRHPLLMDKVQELTAGISGPVAKARSVYAFVRNAMYAQGYTDIYIGTDMEKLLEKQNASPSEINLLLITMLRYANLDADPVLITDKTECSALKDFPDASQFSKTICELNIGNEHYYLDASGKNNAFGVLPSSACNGYARVVASPKGRELTFDAASLKERQLVTVTTESADPQNYIVRIICQYGNQAAVRQRNSWRADSTTIRKYIAASLSKLGMDAQLIQYSISGLHNPDTSLVLQYAVRIEWPEQGNVYFNPHFFSYFTENPFKAAQRSLPISLPSSLDVYYNLQLQLPTGYKLDDAPKPAVVTLNDADSYKYLFTYDDASGSLKLNSRIHMEHTWYPVDHYDMVRQFFDKIIESQQKTYVFKKS